MRLVLEKRKKNVSHTNVLMQMSFGSFEILTHPFRTFRFFSSRFLVIEVERKKNAHDDNNNDGYNPWDNVHRLTRLNFTRKTEALFKFIAQSKFHFTQLDGRQTAHTLEEKKRYAHTRERERALVIYQTVCVSMLLPLSFRYRTFDRRMKEC